MLLRTSYTWVQRKLSDLTDYQNGKGHEKDQSTSGKYELINLNSISIDGGLKPSGKFIPQADETLRKDDLVMILSDVGHGDLLGRVAKIPQDDRYVLNQRVALIRPKNPTQSQYLFVHINKHQGYFKAQGAGMSQLNISKSSVENFASLYPDSLEMTKIGSFFDALDNLIAANQRKLEYLKAEKTAYLEQIFNQKLRFAGFNEPWVLHKVRELGDVIRTGVTPQDYPEKQFAEYSMPAYDGGQKPQLVSGASMQSSRLKISGEVLLINKLNVRQKRVWLVTDALENAVASGEFMPFKSSNVDLSFMRQLVLSNQTTRDFESMSSGTSNSQKRITPTDFLNYKISVPTSKFEQAQIGEMFDTIDNLIAANQQRIALLQNQKEAYLQKIFI